MLYCNIGSPQSLFTDAELEAALVGALEQLGERRRVLIVPPDYTRFHSYAGRLTEMAWAHYGRAVTDVLPAIGTHSPMTDSQIADMFGRVPRELFRDHDWRTGTVTLGRVPREFVRDVSEGVADFEWPAQVDELLVNGDYDLILSIGQVVPHEVVGMANYNKNIFVGTGGPEGINKSHFIGAAYGMERMMGRAVTPVRRILNYASEHFARELPIVYVQTVVRSGDNGELGVCGLTVGDDEACFMTAAGLSLQVNFELLDDPLEKVVCYLDPSEYKSTWLGNKSIYRTRMAIADDGELIVLAPGLREFGEDGEIDRLIRKYGYGGTPAVMQAVAENDDLGANLSAAAHLIHGSSEGRFRVTYCPGHLSRDEIESVGFAYADLAAMEQRYDPGKLREGFNTLAGGERVFFISNPALGLWSTKDRFA